MGITIETLSAWRKNNCSVADVKTLPQAEARQIYQTEYADKIGFDSLPMGLDYAVYDCAVNSGVNRAVMLLQDLVGVKTDGIFGALTGQAVTIALARDFNNALIESYCNRRLAFMRTLKNWPSFADGWTSRVNRVLVDATEMATNHFLPPSGPRPHPEGATAKAKGAVKVTSSFNGKAAVATAVTTVAAAGTAATQASSYLSQFSDLHYVHWALAGLAALSALGSFASAAKTAAAGPTS